MLWSGPRVCNSFGPVQSTLVGAAKRRQSGIPDLGIPDLDRNGEDEPGCTGPIVVETGPIPPRGSVGVDIP